MQPAVVRRAFTAVAGAALLAGLAAPAALAETVAIDGDLVTAGVQNTIDLGTVQPGADVHVDIAFLVTCSGTSHVNADQMVRLQPGSKQFPSGGGFSVGTTSFALGASWPADGEACPTDLAPVASPPMNIVVTAPTTPGTDYRYVFSWIRSLVPTSTTDAGVFEGSAPSISFVLDVPDPTANTAPTMTLPASSTVEGNTTGGAIAAYTATASDAEDTTPPTPSCSPVVGSLLPIGATTVTCSATDSGGLTTTGAFTITVVDTTAPTLANVPGDMAITTSNPAGATLTYAAPTASDVVDAAPVVGCAPASGTSVPVGDTTVTCTARDASGNVSTASFRARVTLAQAIWDDPVGASAGIVVNGSRTVPVKVQLFAGGRPVTTGAGVLVVRRCDSGGVVDTEGLAIQSNGRWMGHLSTDGLGVGCYRVVASVDGQALGSFQMDVRGADAVATKSTRNGPARAAVVAKR